MASTFRAVISDIRGALDGTTLLHPVHLTPSTSTTSSTSLPSTLTPLVQGAWPLYISDSTSPFAHPTPRNNTTMANGSTTYATTLSPILISVVAAGPVDVPVGGTVDQYIDEGALPQTVYHAASAAGLLVREGVDITPAASHHHLIHYYNTSTTITKSQHHVALLRIKSPSLSQVISQTTLHTRVGTLLAQIVTMLDKQEVYDDWKEKQVEARDRHQGASSTTSTTAHHNTHLDPKTVGANESIAFIPRKASRMIDFNVMEGDVSHESHHRRGSGGPLSPTTSSSQQQQRSSATILHRSGSADLRRIASDTGLLQVLWDVAGFDSQADDAESLQEEIRRAMGRQRDATIPNEDVLDRRIHLSSRMDIITAAAADPTLAALQISYLKMKLIALNALRVLVPLPSPLAHTLNGKGLPFGAPHTGVVWPYDQTGVPLTEESLLDMCDNIGAPTAVVSHLFVEAMRATVVESNRLHTLTTTTTAYGGDGSPPSSPVNRRNSSLTSPSSQRAQSPTVSSPLTRRASSFVGRVFGGGLAVEADRGLQGLVCSVTRIQEQLRNTTDAVASAVIQLADHHATGAFLKFKALPLERRNLLYMSSWKSDGGAIRSEEDVKGDGARRFTDEVVGQFMVHYQLQSQAQAASAPVGGQSGGVSSAGGSLQALLADALTAITHTIVGDTTMLVRSSGDSLGALRDIITSLYSSILRSTDIVGYTNNSTTPATTHNATMLSIYTPSIGPSSRKALLNLFLRTVQEYLQQTSQQGKDSSSSNSSGSYIGSVVEESVNIVALVRGLCQVQEAVLGPISITAHTTEDNGNSSATTPHNMGFDDLTDVQMGRSVWAPFISLLLTIAEQSDDDDSIIINGVFSTLGTTIASLRGCSLAASSIRNATKQHTTNATAAASSNDGLSRLSSIVCIYNGLVSSLLSGDCYQITKPPTPTTNKSGITQEPTNMLVFTPLTALLERSANLFCCESSSDDDNVARASCAEAINWCLLLEKENSVYLSDSFVSHRHHRTILPSSPLTTTTPLTASSSLIAVVLEDTPLGRMTPSDPLPSALLAYSRIQGRLSNTMDRLLSSLRPSPKPTSSTRRSSEAVSPPPPHAPHLSERGGLDVLSQALVRIHPQLLVRGPQSTNGGSEEEDPVLEAVSAVLDTINTPLRKALYLQTDEFVLTSSVFAKTLTQGQISHVVSSGVGVSESLMSPRSRYHSPLETALDRAAKKLLQRPRIKVFACSDRSELQHELAQREKLIELTQHEIAVREGSCKAWSSMPATEVAEIRALYAEVAEHTAAVTELKACTDEVMDARVHVGCPAGSLSQDIDTTTTNDGEESLDAFVVLRDVLHFHQLRRDNDSLGSRQHRLSKYSSGPASNQPGAASTRASSVGINNSRPSSAPTTPRRGGGTARKAAPPTAKTATFMYPSLEEVDKNHHFWHKGGNADTKEDEQHLHGSLRVLPPTGSSASMINGGGDDACVREAGVKRGGWVSYSDPTIASQTPAAGRAVNADGLWRSKSGTYSPNLRIEGRWEVGLPDHAPVNIRVLLADLKAALRPTMRSLTAHGKRKLYRTTYSKAPSSSPIRDVSPAESNRPNQHHPHPLPRFLVLPNVPAPTDHSSTIASPNPRQFEADASTATTLEELAAGRWGSEPAPHGGNVDQRDVIPFADGELRAIDEEEAVTQEACRQLAQVSVLYYVGVAMCTRPRNLHQTSSSSAGVITPKHTASPVTILLLEEDHSAADVIATQRYSFNPVVGGSSLASSPPQSSNKPVISGGGGGKRTAPAVDTHTVVSPVTVGKHRVDSFRRATDEYRPSSSSRRPSSPSISGGPSKHHLSNIPSIPTTTQHGRGGLSNSNLKPLAGPTTPRGGRKVSFHVHNEEDVGREGGVDTLGVSGVVVMSDDEDESAASEGGGKHKSPLMTPPSSRTYNNNNISSVPPGAASPSFIARRNVEMLHARMGLTKGRSFLLSAASTTIRLATKHQVPVSGGSVGGRRGGGALIREDVVAPTESLVSVLPGGGGTLFGGSGGIAVGSPAAAGFLLGGTQLTADKAVSVPHHIRRSALLQQRSLVAAFILSQSYATSLSDLEGNGSSNIPNHFLSLLDTNDTCDAGNGGGGSAAALSSSAAVTTSNPSSSTTNLLAAPMLVRVLQDLQAAQRTAAKGYMSRAVSTNATAAFSSVSLASVFTSEPLSASVVEVSLSRLTDAIPAALRKKVAESGQAATERYNELKRNGVTFDTMLGASPLGGSVSRTPSGSPLRSPRRGVSESPSPSRLRPTDVVPPVAASFSSAMVDISSLEALQDKVLVERAEEERRRAIDEGAPLSTTANGGGSSGVSTTKSIASVTSFLLKEVERLKQQLTIAEQERDAAKEEARELREERDQLNNNAADGSMQLLLHNSMIKPLKEELRKVRAERNHFEMQLVRYEQHSSHHPPVVESDFEPQPY